MMIKKADIVIIGGGVQGCSIAYNLAKKGCKNVVVIEKDTCANGSSGRCAAGIRQQFGTEMNCILARESVRIFESLSQELDYDIGLDQCGYLLLAYSEQEVDQFKKNISLQQSLGINARMLTVEEAKKASPPINTDEVKAAALCPTDGHADPFLTTFAYAEAAQRLGVEIYLHTEAIDIEVNNGKISSVITDKGKILTSIVVNAAGGYAGLVGKMVDIDIPVYFERHQILVTEPIDPVIGPALMSFSRNFFCLQQPHGSITLAYGDPNERKDGDMRATWQFAREMAKKIIPVVPLLKDVRMVRQWAGLYCISPDHQPILGTHPEVEGFYMSLGFSGHGFMLAPITGKLIAELILDGEPSIAINKLDIGRFERGELVFEPSVV